MISAILCLGNPLCTVKLTAACSSGSAPSSELPGGLVSPPTREDDNSEVRIHM